MNAVQTNRGGGRTSKFAHIPRAELHRRIWTTRPAVLCQELESKRDNILWRCKALQIPTPPRGFWARATVPAVAPTLPEYDATPKERHRAVNVVLRAKTREELYEAVWQHPVSKLAKDLGVSDVAIAKRCRRLQVPLPPRGYWQQKAAGKEIPRPALPPEPGWYAENRKNELAALPTAALRMERAKAFDRLGDGDFAAKAATSTQPELCEEFGIGTRKLRARCRSLGLAYPPVTTPAETQFGMAKDHDANVVSDARAPAEKTELVQTPVLPATVRNRPVAGPQPFAKQPDLESAAPSPEPVVVASDRVLPQQWKDRVDEWLSTYPKVSLSRRSQVLKGLKVMRASGVSGLDDLMAMDRDAIRKLFERATPPLKNWDAYRSAVNAFVRFNRQAVGLDGTDPLVSLFEESGHTGRYSPWELKRDMAIASLIADDEADVSAVIDMVAPPASEKISDRSRKLIAGYLEYLPAWLQPHDGGPLFVTEQRRPMYRKAIERAIKRLCRSARVKEMTVDELRAAGRQMSRGVAESDPRQRTAALTGPSDPGHWRSLPTAASGV